MSVYLSAAAITRHETDKKQQF